MVETNGVEMIGMVAGDIFQTLSRSNGRSDMNTLKRSMTRVDEMHLHAGLGWLAREGKVSMESSTDGKVMIVLKR